MSYGILNSPLPGLTVSTTGERCCGLRGYQPGSHALLGDALHVRLGMLGQDESGIDTTSSTDFGTLTDPSAIDLTPTDLGISDLPLPNQLSPSLDSLYPQTVGTEFTSNGDGNYTNIQTGQTVPYSVAQQITQATGGATPVSVDTTPTGQGSDVTIVDPNTGAASSISTNNLTAAAQALQAAGQLINAAGQLTSQGRALLNGGNLYKSAPSASFGAGISGAVSSLGSWFSGSSVIPGVPNLVIAAVAVATVIMLPIAFQDRGSKRRRR